MVVVVVWCVIGCCYCHDVISLSLLLVVIGCLLIVVIVVVTVIDVLLAAVIDFPFDVLLVAVDVIVCCFL